MCKLGHSVTTLILSDVQMCFQYVCKTCLSHARSCEGELKHRATLSHVQRCHVYRRHQSLPACTSCCANPPSTCDMRYFTGSVEVCETPAAHHRRSLGTEPRICRQNFKEIRLTVVETFKSRPKIRAPNVSHATWVSVQPRC